MRPIRRIHLCIIEERLLRGTKTLRNAPKNPTDRSDQSETQRPIRTSVNLLKFRLFVPFVVKKRVVGASPSYTFLFFQRPILNHEVTRTA